MKQMQKQKVDGAANHHHFLWSAGFDALFLSLQVNIVFHDATILFLSL